MMLQQDIDQERGERDQSVNNVSAQNKTINKQLQSTPRSCLCIALNFSNVMATGCLGGGGRAAAPGCSEEVNDVMHK
jgi:hypothetical protein